MQTLKSGKITYLSVNIKMASGHATYLIYLKYLFKPIKNAESETMPGNYRWLLQET